MACIDPSSIPIPSDWPKHAKTGFVCAISLAHRALTVVHSWCVNSRVARVRLVGEADRLKTEVALLREEIHIKNRRIRRVPAASRPHYSPPDRLAILALKAARCWNNTQAARAFLVTPATIANWLSRLNAEGPDALVAFPEVVNKFPDFVAQLVQQLKSACPTMGKIRIAQALARAGLHLSPSSVRRMLARTVEPKRTNPSGTVQRETASNGAPVAAQKPGRVVNARYPQHVWHVDLTAVPTAMGFWIPWFPKAMGQVWPFCYWALAIVDHFSRKAVLVKSFVRPPPAAAVAEALDEAIAVTGGRPKYIVSDQGPQFRESYRDWCATRTIFPRFGAIGQHGSIAICERFIRTLKDDCTRRILVPLAPAAFQKELILFAAWYNDHRPHRALDGRTPSEMHDDKAARHGPRFETRPRMLSAAITEKKRVIQIEPGCLRLVVASYEGRGHLPIITLERAA